MPWGTMVVRSASEPMNNPTQTMSPQDPLLRQTPPVQWQHIYHHKKAVSQVDIVGDKTSKM